MSAIEIGKHVAELRQLRRMAAELAEQIAAEENVLKAEMQRQGTDTLCGADYQVSWKCVTSTRFDSKALRSANRGLYDAFLRATTTRRVVVA